MERGGGVALWRQIYEHLRKEILSGTLQPGKVLPTELVLAKRFEVNRHTVRRAIAALAELGLVATRQGSGTYVPESVLDYAIKKRTRFSETISAQSRIPMTRLIESSTLTASPAAAKALGLKRRTRLVCIRTLSEADGTPLSLASHYFTAGRFPNLADVIDRTGSISLALEEFGIEDFTRISTHITARIPLREEAELLRQPIQRPVLLSISINATPDGLPLEYGRTLFAGDRVQMVFEP